MTESETVGCDMCNDWFHPACLKLSKLPTSKVWYCPMCKEAKKPKKTKNKTKQKVDKKDE